MKAQVIACMLAVLCLYPQGAVRAQAPAEAVFVPIAQEWSAEQEADWIAIRLINFATACTYQIEDAAIKRAAAALEKSPKAQTTLRELIEKESGIDLETTTAIRYRYFRVGDPEYGGMGEPAWTYTDDPERIAAFMDALQFFRGVPYAMPSMTGTGHVITLLSPQQRKRSPVAQYCSIEPLQCGLRLRMNGRSFYFAAVYPYDSMFLNLTDLVRQEVKTNDPTETHQENENESSQSHT